MFFDFTSLEIFAESQTEKKAALLFADEIKLRTAISPRITDKSSAFPCVRFVENKEIADKDCFVLSLNENTLTIEAVGIRGLIYGYAYFLRKIRVKNSKITLIKDISGSYSPDKKIRGHQLGYRQLNNTYDKWSYEQYRRYYLDIMYFGSNICEHIPYEKGVSDKNELMLYDEEEFLIKASEMADELDLDVSLWYPNSEDDIEKAKRSREAVFSSLPRLNVMFPPGSDPGSLPPDELARRCTEFSKILKKYHPDATLWPSAQQPHNDPLWGTKLIDVLKTNPDGIDGIITGPNRAFDIDTLRRLLPAKYPIRLYPDITHNVRCEYPVHFETDDWHYALTTALSRECINPRPAEYRTIHKLTERYVVGSVSYSEGVNDDINKAVWADLDFFPEVPVRETLLDYSRLFFFGADEEKIADAVLGLEKNWEGAPENNPQIENTLKSFEEILSENPELSENWRFVMCLFRARCDAFVRRKILFENALIEDASYYIRKGNTDRAKEILGAEFPESIAKIRKLIDGDAKTLFDLIGIQLEVERYRAMSWERGATLDTIDLPVTDRAWLLNKIEEAENRDDKNAFLVRVLDRNKVEKDEYYFSLALDGFSVLGEKQTPDFYMDFQGDRPDKNNGTLPVCLFKLFDHFTFRCKLAGFSADTDYTLMITYKNSPNEKATNHKITVNGHTIYKGAQFGGERNTDFERDMLPDDFAAVMYTVPAEVFVNGCARIEISEPLSGFEIAEFRITKKPYTV
ncbi:MAG: hypothetical protein IKJ88_00460 [Clostridia bacterium]|nr:hypothetical protein [Clostridia bacterium]